MDYRDSTLATFSLVSVRRFLLWSAVILPAGVIGVAFVVRGWPDQRHLAFYTAPMFLAGPLWVRIRVGERTPRIDVRSVVDGTVFILSVARFLSGPFLPFSGHMLFLTYSGLTTKAMGYRLLALLLLVVTTWFKLFLWRDPKTWGVGLFLGILAAGITLMVELRQPPDAIKLTPGAR